MNLETALNVLEEMKLEEMVLKVRATHKKVEIKVDRNGAEALLKMLDLAKAILEEV